jgi:hypothetical protein
MLTSRRFLDDLCWRLRPDERRGIGIPMGQVLLDVGPARADR